MRWSSACPRCRGDLSLDSGASGPFVRCPRCGSVLTGPQERVLLGVASALPGGRTASGRSPPAGANAFPSSAFRLTRRLTRDDLLQLAIRLVREARGDGPDFVREVAIAFEALKREVEGLTYRHERLEHLAASSVGDGGTTYRNGRCRARPVVDRRSFQ